MNPDLTCTYLGLNLRSPLVPAASPRSEEVSNVERMADAGAAAVVFHSLFAEQMEAGGDRTGTFKISPELYCQHIAAARKRVEIPLIASMNATACGKWIEEALRIEEAGAEAIELNWYRGPEFSEKTSEQIETDAIDAVYALKQTVRIPIAVKLTPYYTNFSQFAARMNQAGADGLVLFTRFSLPELGTNANQRLLSFPLSGSMDMRLPMHWIAVLARRLNVSLAASGGIQRASDVIQMLMAGADVTMFCSVLLRRGICYLAELEHDLVEWMNEFGYTRIGDFRHLLSFPTDSHPDEIERKDYIRVLTGSEHSLNSVAGVQQVNQR